MARKTKPCIHGSYYSSLCKLCQREQKRQWSINNIDRVRVHRRKYRLRLKEKILANSNKLPVLNEKICTRCKILKPIQEFDRVYKDVNYFRHWCKDCVNVSKRALRRSKD